jgi:DNA-binding HxlR family transcriptional regulator
MSKMTGCPAEVAISLLSGKWKLMIIRKLLGGAQRFGELQDALPNITHRVLSQQLTEMMVDGLIERVDFAQFPKKVTYELTELGRSIESLILAMHDWALSNKAALEKLGIHLHNSVNHLT